MVFLLIFSLLLSGAFVSSKDVYDYAIRLNSNTKEFDIYPTNYELWLNLEFYGGSKTYTGNLEINVISKVPVSNFSIDCGENVEIGFMELLENDKINLGTEIDSNKEISKRYLEYEDNEVNRKVDVVIIGSAIEPFINYTLSISFSGMVSNENYGIFRTDYFVNHKPDQNRSYVATDFYPQSAHTVFPCFKNAAFKSTFKVHIGHNERHTVISTTPGLREHYFKEAFTTTFEETPPISIQSLSFILTELNPKSLESNGTVIYSIYSEENVLDEIEYLFNKSEMIMSKVEEYFGMKYPLKKLDLFLKYKDSSKMDYQLEPLGLISIFENEYFGNSNAVSFLKNIQCHKYVVHLFVQQYIGNIVIPQPRSDYWIYWIGLIKYIEFEVLKEVMNNEYLEDGFLFNDFELHKEESVFEMVSNIIGKDTFKKAIRNFIHDNKFKNANMDDIYNALILAAQENQSLPAGFDLKEFIYKWITGPGFPLLNVMRDYATGQITLTQNHSLFSSYAEYKVIETMQTWLIPYNFVIKGYHDYKITKPIGFMKYTQEMDLSPHVPHDEWIIFNKKRTYSYIVNYDIENWNMIIKELNDGDFEKIHYLNRAQLLNDAHYLTKKGYLDYKILFDLLNYIRRENNYVVWQTVDIILSDIIKRLQSTEYAEYIKKYINILSSDLYDKYSLNSESSNDAEMKSHLVKWACFGENPKCKEETKDAADHVLNALLHNTPTKIKPNLYESILCFGVSDEKYTKFWHDIAEASYTTRHLAINSLRCNYEKTISENLLIKLYAKHTLQPEFDEREKMRISKNIRGNYLVLKVLYNAISKKPALLFDKGNEENLIQVLKSILDSIPLVRTDIDYAKKIFFKAQELKGDSTVMDFVTNY